MIDEEVPDVKHHRSLFRALSALLCLVLCTQLTACGQKDTFSPASGKRYDDSLISEAISKEGTLTDGTIPTISRSLQTTQRTPSPSTKQS